jgi:hypothetical protein
MKTWLRLLLALALVVVAGCGSDESSTSAGGDPAAALRQLRPLGSAHVSAQLRVSLDNAPADVGSPLLLRFDGPLRDNGPEKLPSLDWKISFTGFGDAWTSRLVSTGSDVFVRLGGADFNVGEDTVGQLVDQARAQQTAGHKGLAALGVDPLAAVTDVRSSGTGTVAGVKVTRYTGSVDRDRLFDQLERLLRGLPSAPGAPTQITAAQRSNLKTMFSAPRFEVDVAADHSIRRLLLSTRFTTPVGNRKLAEGITGGALSYSVAYAPLKSTPQIVPPAHAEPLSDFMSELQRLLAS